MNSRIFRNVFLMLALILVVAAFAYSLLGEKSGIHGCPSCADGFQCSNGAPTLEAE